MNGRARSRSWGCSSRCWRCGSWCLSGATRTFGCASRWLRDLSAGPSQRWRGSSCTSKWSSRSPSAGRVPAPAALLGRRPIPRCVHRGAPPPAAPHFQGAGPDSRRGAHRQVRALHVRAGQRPVARRAAPPSQRSANYAPTTGKDGGEAGCSPLHDRVSWPVKCRAAKDRVDGR